jgi:hypothetical protein
MAAPVYRALNTAAPDGLHHVHNDKAPHFVAPDDKGEKYAKRKSRLQSLLEQYVPGIRIPPTLPVTRRYGPLQYLFVAEVTATCHAYFALSTHAH